MKKDALMLLLEQVLVLAGLYREQRNLVLHKAKSEENKGSNEVEI